ncbi:MAG TPA: hypothetical protein VN229_06525 [Terriglobales bacterium]|nr:hypothetical protein [Terriglobales bacterium]
MISFLIFLCLYGFAAFMMGQALAETWRPLWHNFFYGVLLTAGDRALAYMLLHTDKLSLSAFLSSMFGLAALIDLVIIFAIALFAYRITRARQIVTQYPWLYEKAGLLTWNDRNATRG